MNEEELKYRLVLQMIPGIGPVSARALIGYCGGVQEIFRKRRSQLEKIPGIGKGRASAILRKDLFERAEKEILFLKKSKIKALFYLDKEYPARLRNCEDAPLMLFYKGTAELNPTKTAAVVGTRFSTPYGKSVIDKLVEDLSGLGVCIISGLAYGVDVHAHRCALKWGATTIGVVAHGLDRLYPAEHQSVAEKMMSSGGIISEYPSETNPDRENFPARNRIVAGMSDAVIVIESASRGGALITADLANDYNRDVFALPGRTTDNYSSGCNELIRQNKAMLFENADHIAEMMGWKEKISRKKQGIQPELFSSLGEEEKRLIAILSENGIAGIDNLASSARMPVSRVSTILLHLEFAGVLRSLPGKQYELL